jgi:hypothetical protein
MTKRQYGWVQDIDRVLIENAYVDIVAEMASDPKMALWKLEQDFPGTVVTEQRSQTLRYREVDCKGCDALLDEKGEHIPHTNRDYSLRVTEDNYTGVRVEWIFTAEVPE